MKSKTIAFIVAGLMFMWACGDRSGLKETLNDGNTILQQEDGSLALNLEKAACYNDEVNPASNTAEWKVAISKPGRFKVWLSSATKDTTDLSYVNSVKIALIDSFLEADPACDKIIRDSNEVSWPYYRADSYMGSFYIQEAGVYNIQVISEKILPREAMNQIHSQADDTRLMSVLLTPITR
jgi:hypothetical protein